MLIYRITNMVNGKVYIGQTIRNLEERIREHTSKNSSIGMAIKKYGKDNFSIEIIDKADTIEELNEKELEWIKHFDCMKPNGYNLCEGGGNTKGYKHREESRLKMSKTHKERQNQKGEKNHFYGKTHSDEQKMKWSIERKGYKHTEEAINKMRNNKPNKRKVKNIDTGEVFESISFAAERYNLKLTHISRVCRGIRKRTGGFRWSYYDE